MARRCYVSPIIGTGADDDDYRPATADDGVAYAAEIPTGPDGKPINSHCVVTADEADDAKVMSRVGVERAADLVAARARVEVRRGSIR